MAEINDDTRKGAQDAYSTTSTVNQTRFQTTQALKRDVQTSYLARVDKCESTEETSGATYVALTPLTAQTDAEGKKLEMLSIPKIPFVRVQQGIAAFVLDPVPGDIGVVSVCKHDISPIKQGVTEPVPPGSPRNFSQSDSVLMGAVHTKTPTNHITLRQDDTLYSRCPQGYEWETDKTIKETALEDRVVELGRDKKEHVGNDKTLDVDNDQTTHVANNDSLTVDNDQTITIGGNQTITVSKDVTISIDGNGVLTIQGDFTGTINGNASLTVQGNLDASVQGNLSANVNGSTTVQSQGAISATSSATVTIKANSITLDAPNTTITGNLALGGNLSAGGGAGGGGNGTFMGSITSQQTVTGNSDVIGGGVSLKSHVHGGVETGGGSTSGPR